jgi:mRNA interferase YafQ
MKKFEQVRTSAFRKDVRRLAKQGADLSKMETVIDMLAEGQRLPLHYRDHALKGVEKGMRECHITPDWLLVYRYRGDVLILVLVRTGSHTELFE